MRASGILLHITSLPSPYGIGTMGKAAFAFVDFLEKSCQRYWQILPLNPTGVGNSPYQSCCSCAGNSFLIDLDLLIEDGLLTKAEVDACDWGENTEQVDFALLHKNRLPLLRKAFSRYREQDSFVAFAAENNHWLHPYATYMVLKDQNAGRPWYQWKAGAHISSSEIRFYCFLQYLFHTQWENLRGYAHSKGISIIGDVPIYVPYDSAEVWAEPQWFDLDETLTPTAVAGCPPDCFSQDGQLWGNPLYRWKVLKKDGYRWWLNRLHSAAQRYDVIRLDHFRGFADYYAIPYGAKNARYGQWLPGPGIDFIQAVQKTLPDTLMIAEDLGFLTESVYELRKKSGYPGMKILEFAFDGDSNNLYLPHTYSRNTVCYTGTHDNMPIKQWLAESPEETVEFAARYMGEPANPVWKMIRLCQSSPADLAIVQMQDYLELGAEGRMNTPGTCNGKNWSWRMKPEACTDILAGRIREMTCTYGRFQEMP